MKGWLEKRGPLVGWSWDRRWCVLQPRPSEAEYRWRLVYYVDEGCVEKKGDVDLHPNSRAVGFQDRNPLGDSVKHVSQRPFGFVVDSNPDAGKERHLFYFDAGSAEVLQEWVLAINRVAESCKPIFLQKISNWGTLGSRTTLDPDESEEDESVDEIPVSMQATEKIRAHRRGAVSSEAYGEWNKLEEFHPVAVEKSQEEERRIREALLASPFLEVLATRENDLRLAISAIQRKHAVKGDVVIQQDDQSDKCLYLLESGSLDVYHIPNASTGKQSMASLQANSGQKVATIDTPWTSFGELALLFNSARAATLIAREDCTLLTLDRQSFTQIMRFDVTHRRARYFELLRSVKLLAPLDDLAIDNCVDAVSTQIFNQDEYVVKVGEKGSCVYMVEEGEAVARINGMDARSYRRGDYFGELSLVNERPRAADVVAASKTLTVAILHRLSFRRLLGQNALFGEKTPGGDSNNEQQGAASQRPRGPEQKSGLRFAEAEPPPREGITSGPIAARKGTGFVQADQLKKLLADADANGEEQVDVACVRFDESSEGGEGSSFQRKGTGFVQKEHLRKLLAEAEERGEADDAELHVRFDVVGGGGEPKQSVRRGTGFVQAEQLLKLLAEDGEASSGTRFAADTDGAPKDEIHRKGTGFVQVEQLKKLLAEADADGDEDIEVEVPSVRFDEESIGAEAKQPAQQLRKGTGFVQAEHLRKLLAEADAKGEQEVDLPLVRFDVEEGAGEPKQSLRRGTGYIQAEMFQKLVAQQDNNEGDLPLTDVSSARTPQQPRGTIGDGGSKRPQLKLKRTVSFHSEVEDKQATAKESTRQSAGEIHVTKDLALFAG